MPFLLWVYHFIFCLNCPIEHPRVLFISPKRHIAKCIYLAVQLNIKSKQVQHFNILRHLTSQVHDKHNSRAYKKEPFTSQYLPAIKETLTTMGNPDSNDGKCLDNIVLSCLRVWSKLLLIFEIGSIKEYTIYQQNFCQRNKSMCLMVFLGVMEERKERCKNKTSISLSFVTAR